MPSNSKKAFFADYVFQVAENVYEPAEDSFLFAENLAVRAGDRVLDLGTGCGILGIVASAKADEVFALDTNPYAIHCARENARLNHVAHKMLFIQGDLFAPIRVGEEFDLILFNAPYLPSDGVEENCWIGRSWTGGVTGREVIDRFIRDVPRYLKPGGRAFLMQSTLSGVDETLDKLRQKGLLGTVIARLDVPFFETIVLVSAACG